MNQNQQLGAVITAALALVIASFWAPGWAAAAFGLAGPHAALIHWLASQQGWLWLGLWLLYGALGFGLLAAALIGAGIGLYLLFSALHRLILWGLRTTIASAKFLGPLLFWPVELLAEWLWDVAQRQTADAVKRWEEQRALRRVYRAEYAGDFPSYRAFLRHFQALKNGEQSGAEQPEEKPPQTDPVEAALRLLGLPDAFTKDELTRRFRKLIKGVHPDVVGPNELATLLNNAYTLIKEAKGWT